jgi:hypothetical protein
MPSSSSSSTSATTSERASNINHGKDNLYLIKHLSSRIFTASSPKNLLPLRLDERKDCEFALPFNYEYDASSNAGKNLL